MQMCMIQSCWPEVTRKPCRLVFPKVRPTALWWTVMVLHVGHSPNHKEIFPCVIFCQTFVGTKKHLHPLMLHVCLFLTPLSPPHLSIHWTGTFPTFKYTVMLLCAESHLLVLIMFITSKSKRNERLVSEILLNSWGSSLHSLGSSAVGWLTILT